MNLSETNTISEEEIKINSEEFIEKLIKQEENLHNGEVFPNFNDSLILKYSRK
ncbi:hypothetical protein [Spiroplasma endosymbiont of Virgichneumon dumeticola]|uniref:hypothetical protein n=1 Tax=Spiroplasma endosymbiont of Virgichneumon dumeticola TaxID=3139323 RepID=UPI0035C8FDD3